MSNKNKIKNTFPPPLPSCQAHLRSQLFCLLPPERRRGMENGGCGQFVALCLCCSSLTVLPCSLCSGQREAASSHLCLLCGVFGLKESVLYTRGCAAFEEGRRNVRQMPSTFPVLQEPDYRWSYCLGFFRERLSFWVRAIQEWVVTLFPLCALAADSSCFCWDCVEEAGMSQQSSQWRLRGRMFVVHGGFYPFAVTWDSG